MPIFVTITLEVEPLDTTENVKAKTRVRNELLLINKDWSLLASNSKMDVLCLATTFERSPRFILRWHFVLALRKGQVFRPPKESRHERKEVKLAVQKHYKVHESGKISCLRRECPAAECSAAVFTAATFTDIIVANVVWPIAPANWKTSNCTWVNERHECKKQEEKEGDHGGRDIHYAWTTQLPMNYTWIPLTKKALATDATKSRVASKRPTRSSQYGTHFFQCSPKNIFINFRDRGRGR